MNETHSIALIGGDIDENDALAQVLIAHGIKLEPFGDVSKVLASGWEGSLALVHDSADTIDKLQAKFSRQSRHVILIAFASKPNVKDVVQAMKKGVSDYLAWPATEAALVQAIVAAHQSESTKTPMMSREADAKERIERLTKRERQVLKYVSDGSTNREIAERLGISPRTVEIHRANMLSKVRANNSPEAVKIAADAGLLA